MNKNLNLNLSGGEEEEEGNGGERRNPIARGPTNPLHDVFIVVVVDLEWGVLDVLDVGQLLRESGGRRVWRRRLLRDDLRGDRHDHRGGGGLHAIPGEEAKPTPGWDSTLSQ